MDIPEDLKFAKNDEWVRVEGNTATIGISDYAQDQLSDIVYLEISFDVGDTVEKDTIFGTVESVKAASDLYLPVGGKVAAINDSLLEIPESINSDPYDFSWMIKIELDNPSDLDSLMDSAAYSRYIEERA